MFFHLRNSVATTVLCAGVWLFVPVGCSPEEPDAQRIIDRAIDAHGGPAYESSEISFVFRDARYTVRHTGSRYHYERTRRDSAGVTVDVLTSGGFERTLNGVRVTLTERDSLAGSSTLNSVPYFVLLPFRLNDPAARKRYLGGAELAGEPYQMVEVTFAEDGGGRDWQDRFVYWVHREHHTMDYLAYRFGSGRRDTRFREANRVREVGGIRFADYRNFVVDSLDFDIADYGRLFEEGAVSFLSEVEIDSIEVRPKEG